MNSLLLSLGLWGMALSAFLAGSFVPFSSEAVMAGLLWAGCGWRELFLFALAGNTMGSLVNYGLGWLGRPEWIERYAHVSRRRLVQAMVFTRRYGAYLALLSWIPLLGSALTIALGLLRSRPWMTLLFLVVGKAVRYLVVIESYRLLAQ